MQRKIEIDYLGDCFEVVNTVYRPRVTYEGKKKQLTHVIWFQNYGKWPKKQLNHYCHNPLCVKVSHLYDGSQKQNIQDEFARGNWAGAFYKRRNKYASNRN